MSESTIDVPLFLHRKLTTIECFELSGRIVAVLRHPTGGLPQRDWLNRAILDTAAACVEELSARMRLERSSRFTQEKQRAHAERRRVLVSLRAEARRLARHPDPQITAEQRQSAANLIKVFGRYQLGFRGQGQVETTGTVRLLLQDLATQENEVDLERLDLLRLRNLLSQSQDRYLDVLHREQRAEGGKSAEADEALDEAAAEPQTGSAKAGPRRVREIKDTMADCFGLVFANMAFLARAGQEPYEKLLSQTGQLTAEVHSTVKLRDTLEKKAEAKKALTGPSGTADPTGEVANPSAPAVATPRASDPLPAVPAVPTGHGLAG